MECAAGTDEIKVEPKGCQPVSEDRCASGFMAPAESVTFPEDPLETCCKCKEGETCAYCLDDVCTEEEKKKYVTNKDCFAPQATPPPEKDEDEKEVVVQEKEVSFWEKNRAIIYMILFSLFIFLLIGWYVLPKESPWKSRMFILSVVQFVVLTLTITIGTFT
jgi:hypothetical protein